MVAIDASALGSTHSRREIRDYRASDLAAAAHLLERCGGRLRVRRGAVVDTAILPGLVATAGPAVTGLVTYRQREAELELVVVAALEPDDDTRHELLDSVLREVASDSRRVVACTSNADFALQRSLQLAGFRLCAVRAGAIDATRARLAPGRLPQARHGVPVRDEIEFELTLP